MTTPTTDDAADAAGKRLDAHHAPEPMPRALVAICRVCRFSTSDRFDRLVHLPALYEVTRAEAWLAAHDITESLPDGTAPPAPW